MKHKILFAIIFVFIGVTVFSQDFVYTPKNPAFGGNTFNYQWMLSSANAQNTLEDPSAGSDIDRFRDDPLESFQSSLNRQILDQLSSQIIETQFGGLSGDAFGEEGQGLTPGNYMFGNYSVEVGNSAAGISIVITDNATGNSTEVIVPGL